MKILIKSAVIIDPASLYNGHRKNILVTDGQITSITEDVPEANRFIEGSNLHVSPGWLDMRVNTGDPGFEHKEDLRTASNAAAFGGFTEIVCTPNTKPVIQTKDVIGYIKGKSKEYLVEIHPSGSVTLERNGKELTDMMDMHYAGAVAFSEGDIPVWHTDILLKTLQYLQSFNGLLIQHAEERQLTISGQMNEGVESTMLGLKGIPKLAADLIVERDINILRYTGGKIHFAHISSPASIELIRKAKLEGLKVTCDIASYQLALDDSMVSTFDTNYKVNPPLRTKSDVDLFWKALEEGVIDVLVSDHMPQDEESKNLEFDLAEFGILGLETVFPLLHTLNAGRLSINQIINLLSITPRKILGLPVPLIMEGQKANMTVFDVDKEWTFLPEHLMSRSKNTPFLGYQFRGKAIAVLNKGLCTVNKD